MVMGRPMARISYHERVPKGVIQLTFDQFLKHIMHPGEWFVACQCAEDCHLGLRAIDEPVRKLDEVLLLEGLFAVVYDERILMLFNALDRCIPCVLPELETGPMDGISDALQCLLKLQDLAGVLVLCPIEVLAILKALNDGLAAGAFFGSWFAADSAL